MVRHHLRVGQRTPDLVITAWPFLEEVTHVVRTHDGDTLRHIARAQCRYGTLVHQSGHMAVINDRVDSTRHTYEASRSSNWVRTSLLKVRNVPCSCAVSGMMLSLVPL